MREKKQKIALEQASIYTVQIQGVIDPTWLDYFNEMEMTVEGEDGWAITTFTGTVVDQAALQGLLQNLYNLGLVLLKVERINQ
jgi:hypothetical protein